jgi:type IV secretion system protein VirB6
VSGGCDIAADAGAVRALVGSVDCNTHDFVHRGYEALTGGQGFQTSLTLVLTIYVALVGYRLLFAADGARLTDGPLMALKIGAVLALVTSWSLFETLVFDVAAKAPADIAEVIALGDAHSHRNAPDPIGGLQVAYDQLIASASAFGAGRTDSQAASAAAPPAAAQPPAPDASADGSPDATADDGGAALRRAGAARALTAAAGAVLLADAGLVAAANLVVSVITAVGPIFVILFLFRQTRGFFEGWVRALIAAALGTMSAWTLILLMLRVLDPWLIALAQQRELKDLEPNTAMTAASIVLVFTAAQLATVAAGAVVAFGFRLPSEPRLAAIRADGASAPQPAGEPASAEMLSRAALLADQLRRFDSVFENRRRAEAAGAASGSMRLVAAAPSADLVRLDDGYRRSDLSRDRLSRRGDR